MTSGDSQIFGVRSASSHNSGSTSAVSKEPSSVMQDVEDDIVKRLSDSKVHEFLDFDPTVEPQGT